MHSAWNLFIDVFIMHAQRRNDFPCSIACVLVYVCVFACVCVTHTCMLSVCTMSSHVQSVLETGKALIDERTFALTSLHSGFTLREIWFLTLHCFYCWLKVSDTYTISLPCACAPVWVCLCGHDVCWCVVLLCLFGQYLRLSWCFKCVCCKLLMIGAVICHLCNFRPSGLN